MAAHWNGSRHGHRHYSYRHDSPSIQITLARHTGKTCPHRRGLGGHVSNVAADQPRPLWRQTRRVHGADPLALEAAQDAGSLALEAQAAMAARLI